MLNWLKNKFCTKKDKKMGIEIKTQHGDVPEFIEIKINSWKDLISFFEKFNWSANYDRDWIFRGESDIKYSLSPSLERLFSDNLGSMGQIEKTSLSHFKRRYRGNFKPENSLEWLSLLQHYGAPTRLLDFSYSWYIALFFAVESLSDTDASLWCVNLNKLRKNIKIDGLCIQATHSIAFNTYEKKVCSFIDDYTKGTKVVIPVEPHLLNERIHQQQGLFLISGSWDTKFEDILFTTLDTKKEDCQSKSLDYITHTKVDEVKIFKLIINKNIKKDIVAELFKMNISRETLYQGVEGFAQSIRTRIQAGIYYD